MIELSFTHAVDSNSVGPGYLVQRLVNEKEEKKEQHIRVTSLLTLVEP